MTGVLHPGSRLGVHRIDRLRVRWRPIRIEENDGVMWCGWRLVTGLVAARDAYHHLSQVASSAKRELRRRKGPPQGFGGDQAQGALYQPIAARRPSRSASSAARRSVRRPQQPLHAQAAWRPQPPYSKSSDATPTQKLRGTIWVSRLSPAIGLASARLRHRGRSIASLRPKKVPV